LVAVLAGWYFDWFQLPGSDHGGPEVVVQEGGAPGALLPPQPEILDNEPIAAPIAGAEEGVPLPSDAEPPTAAVGAIAQPQLVPSIPTVAEPAPVAAPAPPSATEAPVVPAGVEHLRFSFEGESWIEVRDGAGKIIYSGVSGAGSTRTVQGKPPFALVIGNARQVSLEYKGEKVDMTPHVRVSVARFALQ
jgi:cytoskeleton protein RodZ